MYLYILQRIAFGRIVLNFNNGIKSLNLVKMTYPHINLKINYLPLVNTLSKCVIVLHKLLF